jgi:hypothetical protein
MGLFQERTIDPSVRAAFNSTGSTIVKGTICKLVTPSPTQPGQVTPAVAGTDLSYGVAMADILTGQWGDLQIEGVAQVLAGATIAAGVQISAGALGKAAAAAANDCLVGMSVTDGVLNGLMEVELTPGARAV